MHSRNITHVISNKCLVLTSVAAAMALLVAALASCTITFPITPPGQGPVPAPPDPYSGRAALVIGQIGGVAITVGDTDQLPAEGGALETSVLNVELPDLLTAEVIHSAVIGQGPSSKAEAGLANLHMTVAGHTISLDFVLSRASARCPDGSTTPIVDGRHEIAELVVDGQAHSITTEPNQTIVLIDQDGNPVGRIIINEQIADVEDDMGNMTVNGMHVQIDGFADIVIAHAQAGILCLETLPQEATEDFVTGGGFITDTPTGSFANFGLVAGIRGGAHFGHLVFIDHGSDLKVKSTSITAYSEVNETTRRFEGTCEVNQVSGFTFEVEVADNGEPGVNDTFMITLSSGYTASGNLVGGNIQLHN